MKLNYLATSVLTSVVIIGTTGGSLLGISAAVADNSSDNQEMVAQAKEMMRSGSFVTTEQDHPTTGKATLITEGGKSYLEFDRAFTTANGPDVQVILYRGNQVPVKIAKKDYISLAPLKGFSGSQRYEIPDNVNLDDYEAVAIWCRQFNVTFGYAKL